MRNEDSWEETRPLPPNQWTPGTGGALLLPPPLPLYGNPYGGNLDGRTYPPTRPYVNPGVTVNETPVWGYPYSQSSSSTHNPHMWYPPNEWPPQMQEPNNPRLFEPFFYPTSGILPRPALNITPEGNYSYYDHLVSHLGCLNQRDQLNNEEMNILRGQRDTVLTHRNALLSQRQQVAREVTNTLSQRDHKYKEDINTLTQRDQRNREIIRTLKSEVEYEKRDSESRKERLEFAQERQETLESEQRNLETNLLNLHLTQELTRNLGAQREKNYQQEESSSYGEQSNKIRDLLNEIHELKEETSEMNCWAACHRDMSERIKILDKNVEKYEKELETHKSEVDYKESLWEKKTQEEYRTHLKETEDISKRLQLAETQEKGQRVQRINLQVELRTNVARVSEEYLQENLRSSELREKEIEEEVKVKSQYQQAKMQILEVMQRLKEAERRELEEKRVAKEQRDQTKAIRNSLLQAKKEHKAWRSKQTETQGELVRTLQHQDCLIEHFQVEAHDNTFRLQEGVRNTILLQEESQKFEDWVRRSSEISQKLVKSREQLISETKELRSEREQLSYKNARVTTENNQLNLKNQALEKELSSMK